MGPQLQHQKKLPVLQKLLHMYQDLWQLVRGNVTEACIVSYGATKHVCTVLSIKETRQSPAVQAAR